MLNSKKILTVLLCAALMVGCGQGEPEQEPVPAPENVSETSEEPPANPVSGGELRLSMRLPKTLNPLLNEDATVDSVLRLIFEPLMELDEQQRPANRLVADVNFALDGLSALITLKPGLKWADGEKITAYDIDYSLNVLKTAPEHAIYKSSVDNILGHNVVDENSIKLNYSQPFGGSAYLLCFPVIPQHFYSSGADSLDTVLGSGLFQFSRFDNNEKLVLTASEDAYGNRPYISEIHAIVTTDRETDLNAFEQNLTDLVSTNISDYGKLLNKKEINAYRRQTTYFDFIGFNFNNPALADIRMRQAVAHAIDKQKLLNDIYLNYGSIVNAPINAGSWLFEPNTTDYGFDPEKSSALLADVGSRVLRILVNEENEERMKIAGILKENLEQSGISIAIEQESFSEYERRLGEGDFDMVVAGFYLSAIPELTFAFGTDAEKNYFSYSDPELDTLLADMFSAASESVYKKAASDLQKYFAEKLPCLSLVFRESVVLTSSRVRGEKIPAITNPFVDMEQWYIYD